MTLTLRWSESFYCGKSLPCSSAMTLSLLMSIFLVFYLPNFKAPTTWRPYMIPRRISTFSFRRFIFVSLACYLISTIGPISIAYEWQCFKSVSKFIFCPSRLWVGVKAKHIWIYSIDCELLLCLKLSLTVFDALIELLEPRSELELSLIAIRESFLEART